MVIVSLHSNRNPKTQGEEVQYATPGNINWQASFSLIQNTAGYFRVPHINNLDAYNNLFHPTGPELHSFLTL